MSAVGRRGLWWLQRRRLGRMLGNRLQCRRGTSPCRSRRPEGSQLPRPTSAADAEHSSSLRAGTVQRALGPTCPSSDPDKLWGFVLPVDAIGAVGPRLRASARDT